MYYSNTGCTVNVSAVATHCPFSVFTLALIYQTPGMLISPATETYFILPFLPSVSNTAGRLKVVLSGRLNKITLDALVPPDKSTGTPLSDMLIINTEQLLRF